MALFLISVAVIFSVGGKAPSIFGYNVYLVKTDAFGIVANGSAIITSSVSPDEIDGGNLVIYSDVGNAQIGEIQSEEIVEGIYSFTAKDEHGADITLTQSQIIGKALYVSDIFGAIISFVSSPMGMLLIAVIPCVILIAFELYKFFRKKDDEEIETVKKQEEVPTYIPNTKISSAAKAYKKNSIGSDGLNTRFNTRTDISADEFGVSSVEDLPQYAPYKHSKPSQNSSPLFLGPQRKTQSQPKKQMPLSQKKLNEAIAATKAEHEQTELRKERDEIVREVKRNVQRAEEKPKEQPSVNAVPVVDEKQKPTIEVPVTKTEEIAPVKQYVPRKSQPAAKRSSSARLDQLLQEESDTDNTRYNIDDILNSLEKK